MNVMMNMGRDGLTAQQRTEVYRRQMLVERDRLEMMHANLQIIPPDEQDDIAKALALRLDAGELAATDGVAKGQVDDFLVAHFDPDDDDDPIILSTWSTLASSIIDEDADSAALARLAEIGIEQTQLRAIMARKAVQQARVKAIQEFREVLLNPSLAYPEVPVAGFAVENATPTLAHSMPTASAPNEANIAQSNNLWTTMTPTEAVEKFFDQNPKTGGSDGQRRRKAGDAWTQKTREQFRLPALLLEQVMYGRPLSTITHDNLVTLDDCFDKLHGPTFRKSPRHRKMTIWEIIVETEAVITGSKKQGSPKSKGKSAEKKLDMEIDPEKLGLGSSTRNRHWNFLKQLTDWFNGHHPLAKLDYKAFLVDDNRNQRDLRVTYTIDQGRELFTLPPWTGSKSDTSRMLPGDLIRHDAFYWVPLLAWYTGMRRDEICGLALADIVEVDGDWQIHVRPNEARGLKTITSNRIIPVADELRRLGLPEYVEALEKAGEVLLFPELVAESGIGKMGDAYYKRAWTKLAKALPFLKQGQAMHSFRHTAINAMKAAKISPEVRADFAGHSLSSETEGRYSKTNLILLREAVDAIPNVTAHLVKAPIKILPARLRAPRRARMAPTT
jgi:integrase